MTLAIRPPQPHDVERIAATMAWIDVLECRAAGHSPWQALSRAKEESHMCWVGEIDGWPHAMFGVVPLSLATGRGAPWFLGTEQARTQGKALLKFASVYLDAIEFFYPRLEGHVAERNRRAIRWLRYMGFVVEDHNAVLMRGEPMLRFSKGFDDV